MDSFSVLTAKLSAEYKDYDTRIESGNDVDYFVIKNPYGNEDIRISDEDGIIFFFSSQHAHFDYFDDIDENIECLIEYINSFLCGKQVAIMFFQGDTALFAGSSCMDDIDVSSGEALLKSFLGDSFSSLRKHFYKQLKGADCRCSIRGWDSVCNMDIEFKL